MGGRTLSAGDSAISSWFSTDIGTHAKRAAAE
jgi:hypothetical protein